MASQSLSTTALSKADSPVPTLPVDTFTEQLTHEPQRKAKLYSLPLIRTAVALLAVFWVIGVHMGNPDGFWQASVSGFPLSVAAFTISWALAGWLAIPIHLRKGVPVPGRWQGKSSQTLRMCKLDNGGALPYGSQSHQWFQLQDRHLVASLDGDGITAGTAVIPLDSLEVSFDLLEGDNPRMEVRLSETHYDTRYAEWTLHLPASEGKQWRPAFKKARESARMVTGQEPAFDSTALRTYAWKQEQDRDDMVAGMFLSLAGAFTVATLALWGAVGDSNGLNGSSIILWLSTITAVTTALLTACEYVAYETAVGSISWIRVAVERRDAGFSAPVDIEDLSYKSPTFPLAKFPNSGRYGGWVSESGDVRQVALLAPSGRQYILDLPRDTTVQYSPEMKSPYALAALKIDADNAEVTSVKLTFPKDAEATL